MPTGSFQYLHSPNIRFFPSGSNAAISISISLKDYFWVQMFITKHLGYKIDSDSKHIPIRAFGYEATKIERNMIMEKKYFANLE